jgi:hypothetical protein
MAMNDGRVDSDHNWGPAEQLTARRWAPVPLQP